MQLCTDRAPQNCHTKEKCLAAGTCQDDTTPAATCTNRTTNWLEPARGANTAIQHSRCERACSVHSSYTCREEGDCVAIGYQWIDGRAVTDAAGTVTHTLPGRCVPPCSTAHPNECHTRSSCETLSKDFLWVPAPCCGKGCNAESGSCVKRCSAESGGSHLRCHSQLECEAVGRQWNPATEQSNPPQCVHQAGKCELPCTEDTVSDCMSQGDCDAIGQKWHPPVRSPGSSYIQPGHCTPPCSLMNPNDCETEAECLGIGLEWVKMQTSGGGDVILPPGAKDHFCEAPCFEKNPGGCKTHQDCTLAKGQWILERMRPPCRPGSQGCTIICAPGDPSCGGTAVAGAQAMNAPPHRQLQATGPHLQPQGTIVGRCERGCSPELLFLCRTEFACKFAEGRWQKNTPQPQPTPPEAGVTPPPTGHCLPGCSVNDPFACKSADQCNGIGGTWRTRTQLGRPNTQICDVSNAPCDAMELLFACNTAENEGVGLCGDQCGRFVLDSYDRCAAHPPSGMTKAQWQTQIGPIASMCKSIREDGAQERCAAKIEEATASMNVRTSTRIMAQVYIMYV